MSGHEVWHVATLLAVLLGAAAGALLVLGPLLFEGSSGQTPRTRVLAAGGLTVAVAVLVVEWLWVH